MIKATLLELYIKKRGSVPIISEPMSVTWIQVSFPTCKKKRKTMEVYSRKKKIRFFNTSNIRILSRKNLNKDNTTYFGLD